MKTKGQTKGHDIHVQLNIGVAGSGVWLDGKKLALVKDVEIRGGAGKLPEVVLTVIAQSLSVNLDSLPKNQIKVKK